MFHIFICGQNALLRFYKIFLLLTFVTKNGLNNFEYGLIVHQINSRVHTDTL